MSDYDERTAAARAEGYEQGKREGMEPLIDALIVSGIYRKAHDCERCGKSTNLDDLHDGELLTSTRGLAASSHRLAETESFMMGGLGNGSRRVGEPDDLGASMRGSMRNGLGASSSGAHASRPGHVRHRTAGGRDRPLWCAPPPFRLLPVVRT